MKMERPWLFAGFSVFCLATGMFGIGAASSQTQHRQMTADDYIEQRCTFCHSRILTLVLLKRRIQSLGIDEIDTFLARHNMPDAEARETLVTYLERLQQ